MSAIENALLEGTIFTRKFFKTFYSLVFRPIEVLNSINPAKFSKEKFFNPFLFYLISTLPTVFIASNTNYDLNTLSENLPGFFNQLTIQKIFLITLPYMVAGYLIAYIGALFFKEAEWKVAYKSYIYYILALPLLSFSLLGAAQAILNHIFFHDFFAGNAEEAVGGVLWIGFIIVSILIPMATSWKEKWQTTKRRIIFTATPIVSIVLLVLVLKFVDNKVGYRKGLDLLPDDLICEQIDTKNFTPEIKMDVTSKKVLFTCALWFYNPTNRIFWAPSNFDLDILNPIYFDNKKERDIYPFLTFGSAISKRHLIDSLMIKPNQSRLFEYKCLINKSHLDTAFLRTLAINKGGKYYPQLKMDYTDIFKRGYERRNSIDVNLVFDTTMVQLWPVDSLR